MTEPEKICPLTSVHCRKELCGWWIKKDNEYRPRTWDSSFNKDYPDGMCGVVARVLLPPR